MFDVFYTGTKPNLFVFEQPASSLEAAAAASRTEYFWFIDGGNDYTGFDFNWQPIPYDSQYTHVFPSQWHANGGVYFAPKSNASMNTLKFQNCQRVKHKAATQIFYMDFMNPGSKEQLEKLKQRYPDIKSTRYVSDHLNVLKRIMNLAESKFVWVISSVCDYTNFDFTWHPEHWQEEMVHCFPSDNQRRGDTFYINVDSFKTQMYELEMLDWFNVINYCEDQRVPRVPMPVIVYDTDNLVEEIRRYEFKEPYAVFTNQNSVEPFYQPCLWAEKDRSIESFTRSNAICAVPRDIKAHLQTQIYDYPYINIEKQRKFSEQELDIIYISNGEPDEQRWFEWTEYQTNRDVKWIRGINGRANAYKAAAQASTTPWFFAVFAKLEVRGGDFPWDWQPDYFQEPKHYIFHAKNVMNGLEYGHQAMIAYNRRLVLETEDSGLDFTLSQPHETVPILSGTAHFNQDPWTTWRTAFREVVKLKHFDAVFPTIENNHRLKVWRTRAEGQYADWCLRGVNDAIEYYDSVGGDYAKLMLTYEWDWLRKHFDAKY